MVSWKMIRNLAVPCLAFIGMLYLTGCTNKDNLTGNNWSGVTVQTIVDSTCFSDDCATGNGGFSFPAEGKINGLESALLCGNWDGVEAEAIMRFTGMPQDFYIPGGAYQDSCWLELTLVKRSPAGRNPLELSVSKLNQVWRADSTALVLDENIHPLNQPAFTVPDSVSTYGTVVKIPLAASDLENWREGWANVADTLGFSMVLSSSGGAYGEILSRESGRGPRLRFNYKAPDDTTLYKYEARAFVDSYRADYDPAPVLDNRWVLSNIAPSRLYVNFNLNYDLFVDPAGNVLSEKDRKRATINKAELILYLKDNDYYGSDIQYYLWTDWLREHLDLDPAISIPDGKISSGLETASALVTGGRVVVNITPIVQAFASGDEDIDSPGDQPFGVIIRSRHEMLRFGKMEFWHFDDPDTPVDKMPRLVIKYTPPFL